MFCIRRTLMSLFTISFASGSSLIGICNNIIPVLTSFIFLCKNIVVHQRLETRILVLSIAAKLDESCHTSTKILEFLMNYRFGTKNYSYLVISNDESHQIGFHQSSSFWYLFGIISMSN